MKWKPSIVVTKIYWKGNKLNWWQKTLVKQTWKWDMETNTDWIVDERAIIYIYQNVVESISEEVAPQAQPSCDWWTCRC